MNYAVVVTKIDLQTKKAAMKTADDLGLPLSVVIKAFLRQFIRTKSVTFGTFTEEPSEYLKNVIYQAEKDWKAGKTSPAFRTGEEAVAYLQKRKK